MKGVRTVISHWLLGPQAGWSLRKVGTLEAQPVVDRFALSMGFFES